MKTLLSFIIALTSLSLFSAETLIHDNVLKQILKTELEKNNTKILNLENMELSFSERLLNPFYYGYYSYGEIRELTINSPASFLSCTIALRQATSYQDKKLAIIFYISFDHCKANGDINIPQEEIVFYLKSYNFSQSIPLDD